MTKVLVTGATGNAGAHVVRELRARGMAVRAMVRDPAGAATKLGDVEVAVGDFSDPAALRRALAGVDRVSLASADGPDKVAHEAAVIDAAAAALGPADRQAVDDPCAGRFAAANLRLARTDRGSSGERGVPFVVLQSTFFMSNLLLSAEAIAHTGQLFAPAGRGAAAMIDPRDVAAAAALGAESVEPGSYLLTCPKAVGFAEVARVLAAATGRPVEYVDVPEEVARSTFEGSRIRTGWRSSWCVPSG